MGHLAGDVASVPQEAVCVMGSLNRPAPPLPLRVGQVVSRGDSTIRDSELK